MLIKKIAAAYIRGSNEMFIDNLIYSWSFFLNICDVHTDRRTTTYLKALIENIVTKIFKEEYIQSCILLFTLYNVIKIMINPVMSLLFRYYT